jgi:hypothetical protein
LAENRFEQFVFFCFEPYMVFGVYAVASALLRGTARRLTGRVWQTVEAPI